LDACVTWLAAPDANVEDYRAYWAVVAQVVPVLALAIVVEARAVSARWKPGEVDKEYRWLILLGWCFPLACFVGVEPTAVAAALDGAPHPAWRFLAETSIQVAMLTLVGVPLVEWVFRGNADLLAGLVARVLGRRNRRLIRQRERMIRDLINDSAAVLAMANKTLDESDYWQDQLANWTPSSPADAARRAELQERQATAKAKVLAARSRILRQAPERWRFVEETRATAETDLEALGRRLAVVRSDLAAAFRQSGAAAEPVDFYERSMDNDQLSYYY
jgi:hypothetical protein